MNTCELLRSLREAGVTLYLGDDGRLKLRGPKDALTRYMRATIVEYLPEIAYLYNERAAIMEYDGGLPRLEAEKKAETIVRTFYRENSAY